MQATLKKTIPHQVEIPLTGAEIADLFWSLDQWGQAMFFNSLGELSMSIQLQAVTDAKNLTAKGRLAMARIGEYSTPSEPTP